MGDTPPPREGGGGGGGALGTAPARAGAATTGLARWRHHRGRGVLPADGRRLVEEGIYYFDTFRSGLG
jgi:hypothetical protein